VEFEVARTATPIQARELAEFNHAKYDQKIAQNNFQIHRQVEGTSPSFSPT
jgi:hypothetical protein